MSTSIKTVAIIGAGKLGVVLAQLSLRAGYTVYIAGSGSPEKIRLSMKVLAPGAVVSRVDEAVNNSNLAILAIPLSNYQNLPRDIFSGKIVIDAMNYWWEVDGERDDLQHPKTSTSEMVQAFFSTARIVKALSHMGYHHLYDEARPKGSLHRKAIAIAGDNNSDTMAVSTFIDSLGFDPLIIGDLSSGKLLEPGQQAFGANVDVATLKGYIA